MSGVGAQYYADREMVRSLLVFGKALSRAVLASALVMIFLALSTSLASAINLYTYTNAGTSGAWNDPETWTTDPTGTTSVGSVVPGNNDVVTILNGFTVFLTANVPATGLQIFVNNGGVLDFNTHTFATISTLSGSGTIRIKSGYFPTVTSNAFVNSYAAGATVNYYDFTGSIPTGINYPNLVLSNSTGTDYTISFLNSSAVAFTVLGNLTTSATGSGQLFARLGTQGGNALTLNVAGNVNVGTGTTFGAGLFNSVHTLQVDGNMTNNGTVQFSNGAQYASSTTGAVRLFFRGTTDRTLACQGPTNLYTLTVDKGTGSTSILSVTSTNVANLKFYFSGQLIMITNGTLRLGLNVDVPRLYGASTANYDLGAPGQSPMLWVDGATVNTGGSAFVAYGKFRITAGSFTSMGGQGCVIREEGQYLIEGGTFTTEKFRPSSTASTHRGTFIMSGGIFNAIGTTNSDGNYARFSLPYPEQVFIMSGGTINIRNSQTAAGALHIGSNEASYNVSGGTINVVLSGTAASFPLLSTAALWNLTISRVAGATPTAVTLGNIGAVAGTTNAARPLVVQNNFTIEGANAAGFSANNHNVTVGGNFVVENGAIYTPGNNTTVFDGTNDQAFNLSGTIASGLNNMTVAKNSGTLTLAGSNASLIVRGTLALNRGILNDGGKTIEARTNIMNNAVHTGSGRVMLNGSATQTIDGNGSGVFGNVVLNNSSVPGVALLSDIAVSGTLTLAGAGNSIFDIGQHQLWLSSTSATALTTSGAGFSSAKMIRTQGLQSDRGIRKSFGNLLPFTFHIGSGSTYTPATIQLTSAPGVYGSLSIKPIASRHPFVVASNTRNLTWYWRIVSDGFSGVTPGSVTHRFNYLPAHVVPAGDDVQYIPARYGGSGWTTINSVAQVDEGSRTIHFAGVDYLEGDFTAGIPAAFGVVQSFYSTRNGVWGDTNPATSPWSNTDHGGPPAGTVPGPSDRIFIGDGAANNHVITITSNAQASGSLSLAFGSTLDIGTTTGHNFGMVQTTGTASGLLRLSSATAVAEFPAGDFGLFIRQSGGSVEYYTSGATSFAIPLTSAAPTNLPLNSYRHLTLTAQANRLIRLPDRDLTVFGDLTVQGQGGTAIAELNSVSPRTLQIDGDLDISSGVLQFRNEQPQTVAISGNVNIAAAGIWQVATVGAAVANELTIAGDIINNGTLDFSVTGNRVCNTTFTGTASRSITGTGSVMDFNVITVAKGTGPASVLNVNASAFSLSGGNVPLVLVTGTFRLTSNQSITIANGSNFNIPAAARLSANGGTMSLAGANGINMRLSGTLEVLSGTVNIGTLSNDNSVEYAAIGSPTISVAGGALNVNSQIRRSTASTQGALTYAQSGNSVVTVGRVAALSATRGVFEVLNSGSSFTMADGVLRIGRATSGSAIADLYLHPTVSAVTGGTIEGGSTSSSNIIDLNSSIPLFNLTVAGSGNGIRLEANPLILRGSLMIAANNYFHANGLNVSIASNLTNSNTSSSTSITAGGYRPGTTSQTTTFNGSLANQTITGTAGNLTVFSNLVVDNSLAGGVISLLANTALRTNGTLTLARGTLDDGGNTITAIGTVQNSSTHFSAGSGSITLAGSSLQIVGGNGAGKFGNLTLTNSSGAVFTANQEVTGLLTLTAGSLFINQYTLYLSNTGFSSVAGATSTRYIITSGQLSNGGVRKAFASNSTGTFVYPIGVAGKYTPATYTISTGGTGGSVTVKPVNSKHPSATGSGTSFIRYYWNVTNNGTAISALTHTYQYVATDEQGTPADYRDAHFNAGAWDIGHTPGNPDPATRIITFTNIGIAGDYTAGEPTAFVNPTMYISVASGDWESDLSVWSDDPPGSNMGPPAGSVVVISEGHTVRINSNTKRPATLDVRGRLELGTTTGHDFGVVSATGIGDRTIQIQSSTFPSGDFSNFVAANGGTVEYNGAVTLPTQPVYNNLVFSGAGTKVMPNTDLTINGALTIQSGTVNNAVSNRSIVLVSAGHDFTNHGAFNAGGGVLTIARHLVNSGSAAVFTGPNGGVTGVHIGGNLVNNGGAIYTGGSDPLTVNGAVTNSATLALGSGALTVSGNVATSGNFTTGSGAVAIGGTLSNSNSITAGTGSLSITGDLANAGAAATYTANANTLTIQGAFQNTGGATFNANTGSITLHGNWSNSGVFNSATGTVSFAGTGNQSLTGSTTFYNVTRSNGGLLSLNSPMVVSNMLTLLNGRITTGSNTLSLTNTATQPVTGQTNTTFIDGRVAISYPTTAGTARIFPVGRGTVYRPVTIYQNAVSSDAVVRVEMINTPPSGAYPATIQGLSEARYFVIDLLSGTLNDPVVELSFNTNGPPDENITIAGNARVVRAESPTGPWTDEGGSGVFSPAAPAGYATSDVTSIVNPTYFALGYQSVPLPITLAFFDAIPEEAGVRLKWATLAEKDNAYFTIERSVTGLSFDSIMAVPGAGNSREMIYYAALDELPFRGVSYYRLKQTDYDGTFTHSRVVRVETLGGRNYMQVVLYPNPSHPGEHVLLHVKHATDARGRVVITSATGRIYFDGVVDLGRPFRLTELLGPSPGPGVYIVHVSSGELHGSGKLLIY